MRNAIIALGMALVLGGCASSSSSSSSSADSTGPSSAAAEYVHEHGEAAKLVQANVQAVLTDVGLVEKEETTETVDELAKLAQEAHDQLDQVRNSFADSKGDSHLEEAETEIWHSANELKNAMGSLVTYTGNPNPATLARFTAQYGPAREEWDRGVDRVWGRADVHPAPRI
jgi:hypothetical protein